MRAYALVSVLAVALFLVSAPAPRAATGFVLHGLHIGADWKLASLDLPQMTLSGGGPDYLAESAEFPVDGPGGNAVGLLRVVLRDIEGVLRVRRVSLVINFKPPVLPGDVERFFLEQYGTPALRHSPSGQGQEVAEQLHLLWGNGCLRDFRPIPLEGEVLYARVFPGESQAGATVALVDLRDTLGPFMADEVPPPGEAPC